MSQPVQSSHFDRPLRRLAWVIPAALGLWILILVGFSVLLTNHSSVPAPPLEVTLAESGSGTPGGAPAGRPGEDSGDGGLMRKGVAPATPKHSAPQVAATLEHRPLRVASKPHRKPAPKPAIIEDEAPVASSTRRISSAAARSQAKSAAPGHATLASLGAGGTLSGGGNNHGRGNDGLGPGSGVAGGGTGAGIGWGAQAYATVEHPPVPIARVLPSYPSDARSQGVEGEVVLRAIVDQNGAVERDIVVVESVPLLDDAAVRALRQWRFAPGRDGANRAVRVVIEVPLRFRLR